MFTLPFVDFRRLANELDCRFATTTNRLASQIFRHVSLAFFLFGDAEVVALLQDGSRVVHAAKLTSPSGLARVPMPFAFAIFQIELGIAVAGDPNGPCGNVIAAAKGDKQRSQFFAVTRLVTQCGCRTFQFAILVSDVVADPIVVGFGLLPCVKRIVCQ